MNTIAKGLTATFLVIAAGAAGIYARDSYLTHRTERFCQSITLTDTGETVARRARTSGLRVKEFGNSIVIGERHHPCRVELQGQIIVETSTR